MAEEPDFVEQEWVYIGRRFQGGKTASYCWIRPGLDDDQPSDFYRTFGKAPRSPVVGGRYRVESLPDASRARIQSAAFQGDSGHPSTQDWRLADKAAAARAGMESAARSAARDNSDFDSLTIGELRTELGNRIGAQRDALLAVIIGRLVR